MKILIYCSYTEIDNYRYLKKNYSWNTELNGTTFILHFSHHQGILCHMVVYNMIYHQTVFYPNHGLLNLD